MALGQPIDIQSIESKALAARIGIRSGHINLKSSKKSFSPDSDLEKSRSNEYESEYRFWFTQDRTRLDLVFREVSLRLPAIKHIECINFDGQGRDFRHQGTIKDVANQGKGLRAKNELHQVFDPRVIGYTSADLNSLRQRPRIERFGHPAVTREQVTAERIRVEDREMIAIAWQDPPTVDEKKQGFRPIYNLIWISPTEGFNVRKATAWGYDRAGKESWRYEVSNVLKLYGDTWYLANSAYSKKNSDGRTSLEKIEVVDAWFNRADPLDAFQIKNFGLMPGQGIYDMDTRKRIVYDGAYARVDIEEELAKAAANSTPLAPVPGTINYWLVAVCIGAAAVGAILIVRLLAGKRAIGST